MDLKKYRNEDYKDPKEELDRRTQIRMLYKDMTYMDALRQELLLCQSLGNEWLKQNDHIKNDNNH